ncbi:MAG: WbqC family protein [Prevotella sp.]|nr:WbqC family protein [Prevotella sp.]
MKALLSTTYFGPVQWYQKLYRHEEVQIEQWESFLKQTYRNRCLIATTQGIQALTVPVERGTSQQIRDIRISDHGNWRHLHWNALMSAYGESPFFEYYQDDIRPFFEGRWVYLFDFNEAIREKMCELLDIQPKVTFSSTYHHPADISLTSHLLPLTSDYREAINPKHPQPDPEFEPKPYYQVYQQKHGFLPNLSILDLLFNMGPESIFYL